ncbi:MAG TPA: HAD hydrolase family protein [Phycisphaerae bacterium]|nr:HAD hydrolase family protein [Phycisphaerae bacterium]HOI54297.1 HAD hydrolase family protein [Phycisphaerae bacterium]
MSDLTRIRLLVCDVDGVLTDGRIIYDSAGAETKQFHVRDGSGLKYWLRAGHVAALLSGRSCAATERRAAELGISLVEQGVKEKWPVMERILQAAGCTADEAAYVGDDLPDLPVMLRVGCPVAVADAVDEVRAAARRVTALGGGQGAVREAIEWILKAQGRWDAIMARYARPDA